MVIVCVRCSAGLAVGEGVGDCCVKHPPDGSARKSGETSPKALPAALGVCLMSTTTFIRGATLVELTKTEDHTTLAAAE